MNAKRLKQFCEYLVASKLVSKGLLKDKKAIKQVETIVDNANNEEFRNSPNRSVQLVLTEYDEWQELYPEMEVVEWPDSQVLMEHKGFRSHSRLINGERGLKTYGSSAYLVETSWLHDTTTAYPQDPDGLLLMADDDELEELGLLD